MKKKEKKSRDIRFFSEKNRKIMCVHTREERAYASKLEDSGEVLEYETSYPLIAQVCESINPVGIRKEYFSTAWTSDVWIYYVDDHIGIREIVRAESLERRAIVEQLELSRRYWAKCGVTDWKIILVERRHGNVL